MEEYDEEQLCRCTLNNFRLFWHLAYLTNFLEAPKNPPNFRSGEFGDLLFDFYDRKHSSGVQLYAYR